MSEPIETTGSAVPATVPTAAPPATVASSAVPEGLESIDSSDLSMPIIKMVHDQALWEDSLSGEQFEEMDVILLGLIKQRVLWPAEVAEEAEAPLCRSYNFTQGHPGEKFPIKAKSDPASPLEASGFAAEDFNSGLLSCTGCNLKEWGSHPTRDVPWCVEQFVFAVMMTEPGEDLGSPAILTLQRSSIKPAKAYITAFVRQKKPLFVARTTLKLNAQSRGSVKYSVPKFVKGVATDPDFHEQYAELYHHVKDFVTTPRTGEAETEVTVTAPATAPVSPAAAAPAPAPAAAPAAAPVAATAAPVAAAPVAAAPVAAAPTVPVVASTSEDDLPF